MKTSDIVINDNFGKKLCQHCRSFQAPEALVEVEGLLICLDTESCHDTILRKQERR